MNLDESQQRQVKTWIEEGAQLSDIQKRLSEEFGIRMTYMEVRFLVDDLGMTLKDREDEEGSSTKPIGSDSKTGEETDEAVPVDAVPVLGGVSVQVDKLARPGAVVSGKATFSDGKSAEWQLDPMGRIGLIPGEEGYRPSQEDMMAFQSELQKELQKMGM